MHDKIIYEYKQELEENGKLIGEIGYKPTESILFILIVGIVCLYVFHNKFGYLFGGFLIIVGSISQIVAREKEVVEVYDDAILLYDEKDKERVLRLPLDRIIEWNITREPDYAITITLDNDQEFKAVTFQTEKAYNLLNKVLPDKSQSEVLKRKLFK